MLTRGPSVFTLLEKITVLVLAPTSNFTNTMYLSLNYSGDHLIPVKFSETPLKLERIMQDKHDPFLVYLYGVEANHTARFLQVNLKPALAAQRTCKVYTPTNKEPGFMSNT